MSYFNFNNLKISILFLTLLSFALSQQNKLTIELKNGNKISGELLNKTDSTYSLKTEFGELVIPKKIFLWFLMEVLLTIQKLSKSHLF